MIRQKNGIMTAAGAARCRRQGSAAAAVPAGIITEAPFPVFTIQGKININSLLARRAGAAKFSVRAVSGAEKFLKVKTGRNTVLCKMLFLHFSHAGISGYVYAALNLFCRHCSVRQICFSISLNRGEAEINSS